MRQIINPQFIKCQQQVAGLHISCGYTQLMVENEGDFSARFEQLKGDQSYQDLSDAIADKTGVRITPQAMNKWVKQSGGITLENAKLVADFFKVSPAWLLFGNDDRSTKPIDNIVRDLPEENAQQTLDFIEYQFHRSERLIASDKMSRYMAMIEDFRQDIAKRKKGG